MIQPVQFISTRTLQPGEESKSGLYGIARKKDGWTLRITTFKELAELARDNSREIVETWILP